MLKMKRTEYQADYTVMEPDGTDPFFEIVAQLMDDDFSSPMAESRQTPPITDQQLRALTRKHLLMMLRDLEKELMQERGEKEHLLLACRAGLPQGRQPNRW